MWIFALGSWGLRLGIWGGSGFGFGSGICFLYSTRVEWEIWLVREIVSCLFVFGVRHSSGLGDTRTVGLVGGHLMLGYHVSIAGYVMYTFSIQLNNLNPDN